MMNTDTLSPGRCHTDMRDLTSPFSSEKPTLLPDEVRVLDVGAMTFISGTAAASQPC
jgi:hypothetical protein